MDKIKLICVVGPTASGKTALAIHLAQKFNGEIISADSMQIYKNMNIATAKPTADELKSAKHHLIDFLSPERTFSVAEFVELASKKIDDITKSDKLPIIAGGTGLYIDTLTENIQLSEESSDPKYRMELQQLAKEKGNTFLLEMLKNVDPESAEKLHENNVTRIIRALEIYKNTGTTMSQHIKNSKLRPSPYKVLFIGLNFKDRAKLYGRIDKRVDVMLDLGLIEEATDFYRNKSGRTAACAIGYKELKPFLDRRLPLDECVENLKRETRRYAKRQLTWFRRNKNINWIYLDECENSEEIFKEADILCRTFLEEDR